MEEEEENVRDKADPVSHLPYSIIHRILALLDSRDTISRMSVLSKDWAKFFKYVDYTTSSFCKLHGDAHTFSIVTPRLEPTQADILGRCLGLILKRDVQVLVVDIYANLNRPMFRLPDILLSASSLTSMTIHGCELPAFLTVDGVKFKYLKLLSFRGVSLDEGVIKRLIDSCTLLEEIILDYCRGARSFCVSGLPYLKKVEIYGANSYERIDIEAPNLCHLLLLDKTLEWGPPTMNLASCQKLTTFCYNGLDVNRFLPNFPLIENLSLYLPYDCDNLELSIRTLKRLAIHSNCDLEKIDIVAPNLLWFEYNCTSSSNPFLKEDPAQPKTCIKYHSSKGVDTACFHKCKRFLEKNDVFKVLKLAQPKTCIKYHSSKGVDTACFHKCKRFLEKNDIFKVLKLAQPKTCIKYHSSKGVDTACFHKCKRFLEKNDIFKVLKLVTFSRYISLKELHETHLSPYELEHVELHGADIPHMWNFYDGVDAVLWCFRPRSLSLSFDCFSIDFRVESIVVKHAYEKLLKQVDEGGITIQIVVSYSSGAKQHFGDLKSLLKALPRDHQKQTITFIKEQS